MHQAPKWFSVVALIALLWNILGCIAFAIDLHLTPEEIAKLPEAQQALYSTRPIWSVAATALAVFAGALGSIALLLKHPWAFALLLLSLLGIIAQDIAMFVLANGLALAGAAAVVLQFVIFLVAVLLLVLSRKAMARGWLAASRS